MSKTFAVSRYAGGSSSSAPMDTLRALRSRLSCAQSADRVRPAERVDALIQAALGCCPMLERVLMGHDLRTETTARRASSPPRAPALAGTRRPSPEPGTTSIQRDRELLPACTARVRRGSGARSWRSSPLGAARISSAGSPGEPAGASGASELFVSRRRTTTGDLIARWLERVDRDAVHTAISPTSEAAVDQASWATVVDVPRCRFSIIAAAQPAAPDRAPVSALGWCGQLELSAVTIDALSRGRASGLEGPRRRALSKYVARPQTAGSRLAKRVDLC